MWERKKEKRKKFKEKNENEEREKFYQREKLGFRKFLCFSTA